MSDESAGGGETTAEHAGEKSTQTTGENTAERARIILTAGTGGAGVSTIAAATGVLAATRGLRTLVYTASSPDALPVVLDHAVGEMPTQIDANLYAQRFAEQPAFEAAYRKGLEQFGGTMSTLGITAPEAAGVSVPPGVSELLLLHELHRLSTGGDWDVLVVDLPPLPAALRLLALPNTVDAWLRGARLTEGQAGRALRPALALLAGLPSPQQAVIAAGDWVAERVMEGRALLSGPRTSVRLVAAPDAVSRAAVRSARTALALHGLRLDRLLINRVLADRADGWTRGWAAAHQQAVGELTAAFDGVPVRTVPWRAAEPIGIEELAVLATAAYGVGADGAAPGRAAADPFAAPGPAPEPELRQDGADGYRYLIPLPLADRRAMDLVRKGDELTVTVGPWRRSYVLPGVLRRCAVTGAGLRNGALVVRFVPDPTQWPDQGVTGDGDAPADTARDAQAAGGSDERHE
jgi:arsenite-transporting ATPase